MSAASVLHDLRWRRPARSVRTGGTQVVVGDLPTAPALALPRCGSGIRPVASQRALAAQREPAVR